MTVYVFCYFLTTLTDHTLTIDNLCKFLEDVHNLNDLGLCLHVPNSKRPQLGRNHRSLVKYWMKYHPSPSWKLVEEALFQTGESDVLMEIRKRGMCNGTHKVSFMGYTLNNVEMSHNLHTMHSPLSSCGCVLMSVFLYSLTAVVECLYYRC